LTGSAYAQVARGFIMDLYTRPKQVIEALDATLPVMLEATRSSLHASGSSGVFVPMARGSATFISPSQFDQFMLAMGQEGGHNDHRRRLHNRLHCDSNWTPRLT